ncbi:Methylmalonyl-CoA mutase [Labilithrix luteola]|uniref:Methylmalonyl-CoA mutase n=1 Tax=Labilithrix luteola TaxID=1391654 RepID=A0A0K1PTD6_9BACT|nr:methylmalonyl-CoA mutase family protein [Labilithrix luteola]AKU96646.1 Methylmalonyl-CoA mutase [Labilithrix luteola]
MTFPNVTLSDWRAQVEKELAGAAFDKALVTKTAEGLSVQPLYTEAKAQASLALTGAPFRICMHHATAEGLTQDLDGGADAIWLSLSDAASLDQALARKPAPFLVLDTKATPAAEAIALLSSKGVDKSFTFALTSDPIGAVARGDAASSSIESALGALGRAAKAARDSFLSSTTAMVSTLPYHDAGADAADEIAIALGAGVAYLAALQAAGLTSLEAAGQIALQVAVGRDTFVELCKLRALRLCWQKILTASGAPEATTRVHAVCSSRTLTQRDPWVNMLRVTTQVFAAVLGGSDLVTPIAFDERLGPPSQLGRRVARNTGLVLREESFLGKVVDPASGSYYFETLTDELARDAWKRFQAMQKEGGIADALTSGRLLSKLESAWKARLDLLGKRRAAVLGVSDFANLEEKLPRPASTNDAAPKAGALPVRHDGDPFERLRAKGYGIKGAAAILVTLGTLAESRPRAGFAAGFFAAGGIRTRETASNEKANIACLCGTDERYGTEAVDRVRALKAAGCKHVVIAGRPGALEAQLREAGADSFIYVGCDAAGMLSDFLDVLS